MFHTPPKVQEQPQKEEAADPYPALAAQVLRLIGEFDGSRIDVYKRQEFVLGVHLTEPHQFVNWKCTNQTDYYWGHYFSDLFSAQKDFVARAQEEVQYLEEQRQNPVRLKAPGYSPWGEVQTCETLCPGAYSVSTAGHGGVMVHRDLADKVFRKEAKECGFCLLYTSRCV